MSDECRDRVRYSLSDKSGLLRIKDFRIEGRPDCSEAESALRALLVGQPLAEIDVGEIHQISSTCCGECMRTISKVIAECKETFAP